MITVGNVFDYINSIAPFRFAMKWDNSGLLIGNREAELTSVLITLDITNKVIEEAIDKGANLIISHHPIIFHPLHYVSADSPVYRLIQNGIHAICAHTNLDVAENGVNDALIEALGFVKTDICLEPIAEDGKGIGAVCNTVVAQSAKQMAQHIKQSIGCSVVRYVDGGKPIQSVAICSGGGGSYLDTAIALGADALIAGDFKHDQFITAQNQGISVFDAGHFHTENIIIPVVEQWLKEEFPKLRVCCAESATDPVQYV